MKLLGLGLAVLAGLALAWWLRHARAGEPAAVSDPAAVHDMPAGAAARVRDGTVAISDDQWLASASTRRGVLLGNAGRAAEKVANEKSDRELHLRSFCASTVFGPRLSVMRGFASRSLSAAN